MAHDNDREPDDASRWAIDGATRHPAHSGPCNHDHNGCGYPPGLTKNETLVWDALSGSEEPRKAYEILDQLKAQGVRAPMTVYRALDGLEAKGYIHKLEGLNAFMLCNHHGPHELQAFLVCGSCTSVEEVSLDDLGQLVAPFVRRRGFAMSTARLEVRGECKACQISRTIKPNR